MRRVIFLFLDGVGLGVHRPDINPLVAARLPTLHALLEGAPLVARDGPACAAHASLVPTDACMGVPGRPQSATGQAAILTGINVPARLGEHYGPRPDARVRALLDQAGLFARLAGRGWSACFCNAYPQAYFDAVARGKRLLSAVPYAAVQGGLRLLTAEDMRAGRALSANFTGEGWRREFGCHDTPVYTPVEAGRLLSSIAQGYHFVFFEHWLTDVLGHRQDMAGAVADLVRFDSFLAGVLDAADLNETLVIVASDHGNVEDCSTRKHTQNPALTLLVGADHRRLASHIRRLDDFTAAILAFIQGGLD